MALRDHRRPPGVIDADHASYVAVSPKSQQNIERTTVLNAGANFDSERGNSVSELLVDHSPERTPLDLTYVCIPSMLSSLVPA